MTDLAGLPPLPPQVKGDALRDLDDAGLDAIAVGLADAERTTKAAMAPFDERLRELRARGAELATERRRRERAEHIARRAAVRAGAKSGDLPSLPDALGSERSSIPDGRPLAEVVAFLSTGGEVRLGFPTRPGPIAFTDGRIQQQAATWGDARRLWAAGWEPGTPAVAGVRVHLVGTRVERVVAADAVVVQT